MHKYGYPKLLCSKNSVFGVHFILSNNVNKLLQCATANWCLHSTYQFVLSDDGDTYASITLTNLGD